MTNKIAEGWVNLAVPEEANVYYDDIKFYGSSFPGDPATNPVNPKYKWDKFASKIAGNFLGFTVIGEIVNMTDAVETINKTFFEEGKDLPSFNLNEYDQIDLPFNVPNTKYSKLQVDIPVKFEENTIVGVRAFWEVLGGNNQGEGFDFGRDENVGFHFEKFDIKDKLDQNSAYVPKAEDDFSEKSGTFIDERDGHKYKWVKIGEQVWMAENLMIKTYEGSWAYINDENNVATYGRLYNFDTACNICPKGWHSPSRDEWRNLISDVKEDELYTAGIKLKSKGTIEDHNVLWKKHNYYYEGNDVYGFSGLPAGCYFYNSSFNYMGKSVIWWTSIKSGPILYAITVS